MYNIFEKLITQPRLGLLLYENLAAYQIKALSAVYEVVEVEVDGFSRFMIPCVYWAYEYHNPRVVAISDITEKSEIVKTATIIEVKGE